MSDDTDPGADPALGVPRFETSAAASTAPDLTEASSTFVGVRNSWRDRISYNAGARLVGRLSGAVITLGALHLVTRYFGPARWGEIVAAIALANLFVSFSDLGVTKIVSRDLAAARGDQGRVYGAGILAAGLTSVAAMVLMIAAAMLIYAQRSALKYLSLDLVLSLPTNALWMVSGSVLIARSRNDVRAVVDVASSLFVLGATGVTLSLGFSTAGYVWWTVVADAVTAALGLMLARRYVRANLRAGRRSVRSVVRDAAPVGLGAALNNVYLQLDVILLALFVKVDELGPFGVAYQVAIFASSVPPMLTAAMLPKFLNFGEEARRRLAQRAFDVLVFAGAGVALIVGTFAHSILGLISGARFETASGALMLLGLFAALTFPLALFLDGLVYVHSERQVVKVVAVSGAVNLCSAAILIPSFGANGAAAAIVLSGVVGLLIAGSSFQRRSKIQLSFGRGGRFVAVAALCGGLFGLIEELTGFRPSSHVLLLPEIVLASAAYLVGCAAVGARSLMTSSR